MGICHSDGKKTQGKKNNKNGNHNEPIVGETNGLNKLKSSKRSLNFKDNDYNINIINIKSNIEIKNTIRGNQILSKIIKDKMNLHESADYEIEFENGQVIKNDKKDNEFGEILNDIFGKDIPEIIKMKFVYKGLDLPENAIQSYIENNTIIGNAILDNNEKFGVITYDINTNLISSYYYNIKDYPILNYINNFTAYCNAKGFLYFSGGESEISNDLDKTSLKYNDFFSLDLTTLTKDKLEINELPNLKEDRTWHSMIYVPSKYIFIVGGSNTKSVELYDIEEKKLTKDSELNEIRCECTLCLVNNMYLYAFFGFVLHQEYNNSIERCNLLKENRKWEYVNYDISQGLDLKLSFFGISYFKDNELLLIGGNDNDSEKRYDYNYIISQNEEEKDIIKEFNCELTETNVVFRDKLFLPVRENRSINIPVFVGENIKIFILENGKINVLSHQHIN
jgi:hypothetical protein